MRIAHTDPKSMSSRNGIFRDFASAFISPNPPATLRNTSDDVTNLQVAWLQVCLPPLPLSLHENKT